MIYTFTNQARQDLNDIIEYIARNNPAAAINLVRSIDEKCETVTNFPNMGKSYEDLAPQLRGVTVNNYVIFYRQVQNGIQVVRVLSGYRDFEAIFSAQDNGE